MSSPTPSMSACPLTLIMRFLTCGKAADTGESVACKYTRALTHTCRGTDRSQGIQSYHPCLRLQQGIIRAMGAGDRHLL